MHYMLHYTSQIHKFGPLVCSWTMRHEAKLQVIKRAARHGNFKNICYTIAKRSQHALCYYLNCAESFLYNPIEISKKITEQNHANEPQELQMYIKTSDSPVECVKHPT